MGKITQEEIQARIDRSKEKYRELQEERQRKKQQDKETIAFIHENKLPVFYWVGCSGVVTMVAEDIGEDMYNMGFAFKSPTDQFSGRTGKILAAKRLLEKTSGYFTTVICKDPSNLGEVGALQVLVAKAGESLGLRIPTWLGELDFDQFVLGDIVDSAIDVNSW